MVLNQRRRRNESRNDTPVAPIQFRLDAREEHVTTAEGRILTGRGYVICDAHTGEPLGEDDFFFRIGGGIVCDLVGTDAHLDALQGGAFGPGRTLGLVRKAVAGNGPPRIEVFDADRQTMVGELPIEVADAVAFYGADSYQTGFCLWEWRTEIGQRFSVRLLLAPGWTTEELPEEEPTV